VVSDGDPIAEELDAVGGIGFGIAVFSTPALICCTGPKGVDDMVGPPGLAEGERVGLNAAVGEDDLEDAVATRPVSEGLRPTASS